MGKSLVIVESPAKARTLKRYLGKDFDVLASVGHVKDLPKRELGVDVEHEFQPTYEILPEKQEVVDKLRRAANKADVVYLAPDPDREGEAIAWHIAEELRKRRKDLPIRRATFHEITPRAVRAAIAEPGELNPRLYEAQQARRILDRLVGYQISPLLWKKVRRGLSAGRVQSVAVRLIVDREREIAAFVPEEYWTVDALLVTSAEERFTARAVAWEGEKLALGSEADARRVEEALTAAGTAVVTKVTKKAFRRRPAPPFITSTLQQEAARKLRFSARKTMQIAQRLYEGVELGESGPVGLITYMRTDSVRVADEAIAAVRNYIARTYGEAYLPPRPNRYTKKGGGKVQDAHEAIRPTSLERPPTAVKPYLSRDEYRLYKLIWERFVGSQMAPAVYDRTTVELAAGPVTLRVTGSVLRFKGYLEVYEESREEEGNDKEEAEARQDRLPELHEGDRLRIETVTAEQHFTKPPPRFTEASLIKELEERGIGRPSTYATILSTIQQKRYVTKEDGRFKPTELGTLVTDLLVEAFPQIMDVGFTADVEARLDRIEEGSADWRRVLAEFYEPFQRALAEAEARMADLKAKGKATEIPCPECGAPMVLKVGRQGEFLSCSNYPTCKASRDVERDEQGRLRIAAPPEIDEVCPECGRPLAVRRGRYGPFVACTGYPECRYTQPLEGSGERSNEPPQVVGTCPECGGDLVVKRARTGARFVSCSNYPRCKHSEPYRTGVACPREGCGGEFVERASKRGRRFWGCSNYPTCREVVWNEPVPRRCPECGHPYLVVRRRKQGARLACPTKACGHEEPYVEGPEASEPAATAEGTP